jgi:hypothetical protein
MALLSIDQIKSRAKSVFATTLRYKKAGRILESEQFSERDKQSWDIFLSHSYQDVKLDNEALLGLRSLLKELGFTVYIDWIEDEELDRKAVSKETAAQLKSRMNQSKCLFFATSQNSASSKWMPWELGYFDGSKANRVAVLPLTGGTTFRGQEYLGLYPYVDQTGNSLWIHSQETDKYVSFTDWLKGKNP